MFLSFQRRLAGTVAVLFGVQGLWAADLQSTPERATIALSARDADSTHRIYAGKLLVREVLRQSVLIAAREELGAVTRDMALREAFTNDNGTLLVEAGTAGNRLNAVRLRLSLEAQPPFYEKEVPLEFRRTGAVILDMGHLVQTAEELSRTEFVDALSNAGLKGRANRANPSTRVPDSVEELLGELNFVSQFHAVQELHDLQRKEGASPATLGALVRAYANLGQLTSFHWNGAHKVFKARAMLYAQRLVRSDRNSTWALEHRAYAFALAGLHYLALEDLAGAEKLGPAADSPVHPEWVPLVSALCHYDRAVITKACDDDKLKQLAALLSFLAVENSRCENLTLTTGRRSLEIAPECYAICDAMVRDGGVGNLHETTVYGPKMMLETLAGRLLGIPTLPEAVQSHLKSKPDALADPKTDIAWAAGDSRTALIHSLVAASADPKLSSEPSWEVLGRLIEDATFVHAYRRLDFFSGPLGFPPASYEAQANLAERLLRDHPYVNAVKCAALNSNDLLRIHKLCEQLEIVDADIAMRPLASRATYKPPKQASFGKLLWAAAIRHADDIVQDAEALRTVRNGPVSSLALRAISPHSPQAAAMSVAEMDQPSAKVLEEIETKYAQHPRVLREVAGQHAKSGDFLAAERTMKKSLELSPDQAAFQELARMLYGQKRFDEWKAVLDESLKHEDFGLAHARTRVTIAQHLAGEKKLEEALVYALDAAESGAAWAMLTASALHEQLGHWDEAEEWLRATSERYPGSAYLWYSWCRCNSRGDVAAAEPLARQFAIANSNSPNVQVLHQVGYCFLLMGKRTAARTIFEKAFDLGDTCAGIHCVLMAHESNDRKSRDKALSKMAVDAKDPKKEQVLHSLAAWLEKRMQSTTGADPDVQGLEQTINEFKPEYRVDFDYFAGRYFEIEGQRDLAEKYLRRAAEGWSNHVTWTLARAHLHDSYDGKRKSRKQTKPTSRPAKAN